MLFVNRNKIIFLVTQSEFGGAQRYIFELALQLNLEKYEVLVAAGQGDGELFQRLKNTSVRTIHLKQMKRTPWPWQIFLLISEILNLLKKEKPDTLFLCSTTAGILGSLASYLYKTQATEYKLQTIYRIGGWAFRDPRPFWQNQIILWLEKLTASLKDKIIVNSEIDKEVALKLKICLPEKIVKIYNGININKLDFLPKDKAKELLLDKITSYQLPATSYIIGTVANFYRTKGLDYLIKAAHYLKTSSKFKILNFKILIIGEGKQRNYLESLIRKYNLEKHVFLLGRIPEAFKYLKAFDVFVLPSLKEGFPWIILEAMAARIPIIATGVGALSEIIENEREGFLVKSKDSQAIAEKILKLIENPQLTQKLSNQAREKVKKFSFFNMIQETEKLL